jgi:CubicO group peptidase (beta-lactamase class C family)
MAFQFRITLEERSSPMSRRNLISILSTRYVNRLPRSLAAGLPLAVMLLLGISVVSGQGQSPDPDSPRWLGVMALREFFSSTGEESLDQFINQKISTKLSAMYAPGQLRKELETMRADLRGMKFTGARPLGEFAVHAEFQSPDGGEEAVIPFTLEVSTPHKFQIIGPLGSGKPAVREGSSRGDSGERDKSSRPASADLSWENLEDRMAKEARKGFNGTILVARDGRIVFNKGYGFADPAGKIPIRPDTIYAIGSGPIDFTNAGILLLEQEGKLSLSDKITKYFRKVPADKRAITLDHLMTGRSGLQDFHGKRSDGNPDHFYIDREEAMRRIFASELLFEPGKGRKHSHSAWGVLAAVIEIVSGQSYPEFTQERLFEPAGMVDTGFFGEAYDRDRMAIGQGDDSNGEINAPPYWGPTSWLVMGSGGQVSTTKDLWRWHRALGQEKILKGDFLDRYWSPPGSMLAGGDQFGFEMMGTQGPESMMMIISNTGSRGSMAGFRALGEALAGLVNAGKGNKFSLGIRMGIEGPDKVTLETVVEGGAASRDGLITGDTILTIGGKPIGDDPMALLDPYLQSGEAISFGIERSGKKMKVTVKPDPR